MCPAPVFNGRVRFVRVLPVLSVVFLAGCGVAGTQFHPGIAAEVGDQTITTRHVDQVTDDYCAVTRRSARPTRSPATSRCRCATSRTSSRPCWSSAPPPSSWPTSTTWQPGSATKSALASFEPQLESLTDEQKDAFREILGARAYTNDVLTQIGEISLEDQGTTDSTQDDQLAEGQKLLKAWTADNDVEVNPKYAVDLDTPGQADTDLSVAVGSKAKDGLKAEPDPAYTSSLPGHLVCLD